MKCFSPYVTEINSAPVAFPCGTCPACRLNKKFEWTTRLMLEAQAYDPSDIAFVTLTYDEAHCPPDYNLRPHDLSSFIKRMRTYLTRFRNEDYRIRYYGVGEYGERFGRPHYHLIIFGLKQEDYDIVNMAWTYGRIDCQNPASPEHAVSYVAGYVTKKFKTSAYDDRVPPFSRQSQGIGKTFVLSLPFYTDHIYFGKKKIMLCRYLVNKLAEKFGYLEEKIKESIYQLQQQVIDITDKFSSATGKLREDYSKFWFYFRDAWLFLYEGDINECKAKIKLIHRSDL